MKIFTIIVFGYAVVMAILPIFKKDFFHKDTIVLWRSFRAISTICTYVWVLNAIWEYETV